MCGINIPVLGFRVNITANNTLPIHFPVFSVPRVHFDVSVFSFLLLPFRSRFISVHIFLQTSPRQNNNKAQYGTAVCVLRLLPQRSITMPYLSQNMTLTDDRPGTCIPMLTLRSLYLHLQLDLLHHACSCGSTMRTHNTATTDNAHCAIPTDLRYLPTRLRPPLFRMVLSGTSSGAYAKHEVRSSAIL